MNNSLSPQPDPFLEKHPLSKLLFQRPEGPMRSPARVLGWFSIALGVVELLAPRQVGHAAGVGTGTGLLRAHGIRELACGAGLLLSRDPAPWLWARAAGDVLDIATASSGVAGPKPLRSVIAMAALAGVMAIDVKTAAAAHKGPKKAVRDYSDRSGFSKPALQMRGAALTSPLPTGADDARHLQSVDAGGAGQSLTS